MSKRGGHHGGSWKVAYADFVTAMMALFLCLWIVGQDQKIREAVERAFRQPYAIGKDAPSSILPKDGKDTQNSKESRAGAFQNNSAVELAMALLTRAYEDLLKVIDSENDMQESVKVEQTPDGLRISVFDKNRKPVFEPDSTNLTRYGEWVFTTLAWYISRYETFKIELEGHTEKGRPDPREGYGSWELSADRANIARRKLVEHGVRVDQVNRVAGYADTVPMPDSLPESEVNRRVTVLLRVKSTAS